MVTETEQSDGQQGNEQKSETLRSLLQEYRQIADLSVEQAAETLCLTVSTIKALENEEFNKLPEPPYMRGYLRNYARFADKDPAHIIEIYHQQAGIKKHAEDELTVTASSSYNNKAPTPVLTPTRFRFALITALLLLLILLSMIPAVRQWATNTWNNFAEKSTAVEAPTTRGLPSLVGNLPLSNDETEAATTNSENTDPDNTNTSGTDEGSTVENTDSDKQSDTDGNQEDDNTQQGEDGTDSLDDTNTSSDTETATDDATVKGNGDTHLKLVFTDKVWLRIRNSTGKTLYESVNPAGVTKELKLNSPLKFKVGNANHLKLFVDGDEMDITEYTRGSVATFGIE